MNNSAAHQQLVDDIMFAVGKLPDCRIFPQTVGLFRGFKSERKVKVGVSGMADLRGFKMRHSWSEDIAHAFEIECKTGGGKLSKDQEKWKEMCLAFNVIYIQARSVDQVLTELSWYR